MKKRIIILLLVLLISLLGAWIWYYKNNITNNTTTQNQNNTGTTNTGNTVPELITKNFSNKFHFLDLRNKNLGSMPDLCSMVKNTHYIDDIWGIDLADNSISSISKDLGCFRNLSELYLSFNKISKIENLDNLGFLQKLDLGNNEIAYIGGLDKLKSLTDLHIGYNQITKTSGLESLKFLISLQLQHNKIDDISALSTLATLETLKLEYNNLDNEDIKIIEGLKKLKIITVGENKGIDKKIIDQLNAISLKNMNIEGEK